MDYGTGASSEAINLLENFWPRVTYEIQNLTSVSFFFKFICLGN